jgi:hypothetical protein
MVLAVRLDKREESGLAAFSRRRHLKKSQTARELMREGYRATVLEDFRHGRLSLGAAAETLDLTVPEAMALIAERDIRQEWPPELVGETLSDVRRFLAPR